MLLALQKVSRIGGIAAQSAANTAAATSAWIDVRSYEGDIMFESNIGALTGSVQATIEDATDSGGTGSATMTPNEGVFTNAVGAQAEKRTVGAKATRGFVRYRGVVTTGPALIGVGIYAMPKN